MITNISKMSVYRILQWSTTVGIYVKEVNNKELTAAYNILKKNIAQLHKDIKDTNGKTIYGDTLDSLVKNVSKVKKISNKIKHKKKKK